MHHVQPTLKYNEALVECAGTLSTFDRENTFHPLHNALELYIYSNWNLLIYVYVYA